MKKETLISEKDFKAMGERMGAKVYAIKIR